ncbi:hypothetical protein [uncultured Roseobacter sp.]|uniref:hypothetical protein n=1 Tax=uncultured Roseobacter sp. TaxID=114847 RepID=UPI0034513046
MHGVWTPETARREAKTVLGQIAQGQDPATEREEERRAVTVRELCQKYIANMKAGLVLGKGGRPKKATTVATDSGHIRGHIIPLLGTRRMKDIIVGKTSVVMKTEKLRSKADHAWRPRHRHPRHGPPRRRFPPCDRGRNHQSKPDA